MTTFQSILKKLPYVFGLLTLIVAMYYGRKDGANKTDNTGAAILVVLLALTLITGVVNVVITGSAPVKINNSTVQPFNTSSIGTSSFTSSEDKNSSSKK